MTLAGPTFRLWDKILIVACAYEKTPSTTIRGVENTPARQRTDRSLVNPLDKKSPMTKREDCLKIQNVPHPVCTYFASLVYGTQPDATCSDIKRDQFWSSFFKNLMSNVFIKGNIPILAGGQTVVIPFVTHHHRLDELIFPRPKSPRPKIANGAIFRLAFVFRWPKTELEFKLLDPGVPDKPGKYIEPGTRIEDMVGVKEFTQLLTNTFVMALLKVYNTTLQALKETPPRPSRFIFYVCRHSNAAHNRPLNKKTLDSPLTMFGVYQAAYMGEVLKQNMSQLAQEMKGGVVHVVPTASSLRRTQQTLLIMLNRIFGTLPRNFQELLYYFTLLTMKTELLDARKRTSKYDEFSLATAFSDEAGSGLLRARNLAEAGRQIASGVFNSPEPFTAPEKAWIESPLSVILGPSEATREYLRSLGAKYVESVVSPASPASPGTGILPQRIRSQSIPLEFRKSRRLEASRGQSERSSLGDISHAHSV